MFHIIPNWAISPPRHNRRVGFNSKAGLQYKVYLKKNQPPPREKAFFYLINLFLFFFFFLKDSLLRSLCWVLKDFGES